MYNLIKYDYIYISAFIFLLYTYPKVYPSILIFPLHFSGKPLGF